MFNYVLNTYLGSGLIAGKEKGSQGVRLGSKNRSLSKKAFARGIQAEVIGYPQAREGTGMGHRMGVYSGI